MAAVRIVCDSTSDLPPEYREEHAITTVPLSVLFGDEALRDGVDIDARAFYERIVTDRHHPKTSQPSPAAFEAVFRDATDGGGSVVCTTLSAEISGTYESAVQARQALPDRDIRVIDTRAVSVGHGQIVREAAAAVEAGRSADEVADLVTSIVRRQRCFFTVRTLEYLRRGGRVRSVQALVGSVLDVKPILQVRDGHVEPFTRVRTFTRALDRVADEVRAAAKEGGRPVRAMLGHAAALDDVRQLRDRIADCCDGEPEINDVGPVIGCHAGPGTLGVAFYVP